MGFLTSGWGRVIGWDRVEGKEKAMAYDEGLAHLLREDLGDLEGLSEKRMFGGLCFLDRGNMICGVHAGGAMFRVGKAGEPVALSLAGVGPMRFTGRPMGGMVDVSDEAMADDHRRAKLMSLARAFTARLPSK